MIAPSKVCSQAMLHGQDIEAEVVKNPHRVHVACNKVSRLSVIQLVKPPKGVINSVHLSVQWQAPSVRATGLQAQGKINQLSGIPGKSCEYLSLDCLPMPPLRKWRYGFVKKGKFVTLNSTRIVQVSEMEKPAYLSCTSIFYHFS